MAREKKWWSRMSLFNRWIFLCLETEISPSTWPELKKFWLLVGEQQRLATTPSQKPLSCITRREVWLRLSPQSSLWFVVSPWLCLYLVWPNSHSLILAILIFPPLPPFNVFATPSLYVSLRPSPWLPLYLPPFFSANTSTSHFRFLTLLRLFVWGQSSVLPPVPSLSFSLFLFVLSSLFFVFSNLYVLNFRLCIVPLFLLLSFFLLDPKSSHAVS